MRAPKVGLTEKPQKAWRARRSGRRVCQRIWMPKARPKGMAPRRSHGWSPGPAGGGAPGLRWERRGKRRAVRRGGGEEGRGGRVGSFSHPLAEGPCGGSWELEPPQAPPMRACPRVGAGCKVGGRGILQRAEAWPGARGAVAGSIPCERKKEALEATQRSRRPGRACRSTRTSPDCTPQGRACGAAEARERVRDYFANRTLICTLVTVALLCCCG